MNTPTITDDDLIALKKATPAGPADVPWSDSLAYARAVLALAESKSAAKVAELEARIAELDRLCEETYVAEGADAYNHACDLMEQWQSERAEAGLEVGTTGSLCDGIAWLYERIAELEAAQSAQVSEPVALDSHNVMTAWTPELRDQRVSAKGFHAARAVIGTTSLDDDRIVYRALQAYLYAAQPAQVAAPLQGGLTNVELALAWSRKLPGVQASDSEMSAFAVGVEVGFAHARDLERQDWDRVHHVLAKHGKHPGRTDDHLADVIDRALAQVAAPDDYLGGVNLARLQSALTNLGCATAGQEETAARLGEFVNRLTDAVLRSRDAQKQGGAA